MTRRIRHPLTARRAVLLLGLMLVIQIVFRVMNHEDLRPATTEVPETFLPEPAWLPDYAPASIDNAADVTTLWQSEPRCCTDEATLREANRRFHAACHHAIARHGDDDELVSLCLWLMGGALEPVDRRALKERLVTRYFAHDQDVSHCANCAPADRSVRGAQSLAAAYWHDGERARAVALLERALDERHAETSPWVQVEVLTRLAQYYYTEPPSEERLQRLGERLARLEHAADDDETIARRLPELQRGWRLLLE